MSGLWETRFTGFWSGSSLQGPRKVGDIKFVAWKISAERNLGPQKGRSRQRRFRPCRVRFNKPATSTATTASHSAHTSPGALIALRDEDESLDTKRHQRRQRRRRRSYRSTMLPPVTVRRSAHRKAFEAAGQGAVKLLSVRDSKSKAIFGQIIPSRGIDEKGFSVGLLVEDVNWLG